MCPLTLITLTLMCPLTLTTLWPWCALSPWLLWPLGALSPWLHSDPGVPSHPNYTLKLQCPLTLTTLWPWHALSSLPHPDSDVPPQLDSTLTLTCSLTLTTLWPWCVLQPSHNLTVLNIRMWTQALSLTTHLDVVLNDTLFLKITLSSQNSITLLFVLYLCLDWYRRFDDYCLI